MPEDADVHELEAQIFLLESKLKQLENAQHEPFEDYLARYIAERAAASVVDAPPHGMDQYTGEGPSPVPLASSSLDERGDTPKTAREAVRSIAASAVATRGHHENATQPPSRAEPEPTKQLGTLNADWPGLRAVQAGNHQHASMTGIVSRINMSLGISDDTGGCVSTEDAGNVGAPLGDKRVTARQLKMVGLQVIRLERRLQSLLEKDAETIDDYMSRYLADRTRKAGLDKPLRAWAKSASEVMQPGTVDSVPASPVVASPEHGHGKVRATSNLEGHAFTAAASPSIGLPDTSDYAFQQAGVSGVAATVASPRPMVAPTQGQQARQMAGSSGTSYDGAAANGGTDMVHGAGDMVEAGADYIGAWV
ncbi:hypothetical protein BESB_020700 [Besnoitia besnoiti]|uniref:Uncharacterized protein n=1 Tax=Besnoitia besnoiti TaxID=94643 RepID=A0A2A9M2E6_BESBE|nr:hypothetical protein BESB_020700 [Besnoitia besnoiti]PFH32129.1 hypothetical protein BESB_020700 [Besnoitia besnoiti]